MELALVLVLRPERLAVCRLEPASPPPPLEARFWSVIRRDDELSVVLPEGLAAPEWRAVRGFRALVVEGVLDFSLIGVLARLSGVLAAAGVSIFALSTFDTDVLLLRETDLERGVAALREAGVRVRDQEDPARG